MRMLIKLVPFCLKLCKAVKLINKDTFEISLPLHTKADWAIAPLVGIEPLEASNIAYEVWTLRFFTTKEKFQERAQAAGLHLLAWSC